MFRPEKYGLVYCRQLHFQKKSKICQHPLWLSRPKSTSVFKDRSWASSIMMAEYLSKSGSFKLSLSKIPSVMYFITVESDVQSSKRMA
ncbi:hypothetical protein BpHYR1_007791 [Brachionus plicatilis]|uniref:Uncharacterized protein n=1 Tax=Brachionus plicatilis TaxID=10195 RepID=A0A3M7PQR0_BRAPC|nr:hypothetical protein BpHYR1_007791 [Brachionus plicatilis]